MKVDLTKRQVDIIIKALEEAWDCFADCPLFEGNEETIRRNLLKKFRGMRI